jgi:hypothetical protein
MWLARFFGGRKVQADDEPARYARPASATVQPAKRSVGTTKVQGSARPAQKPSAKVKSGFDPYNSGAFERGNAWERVLRR